METALEYFAVKDLEVFGEYYAMKEENEAKQALLPKCSTCGQKIETKSQKVDITGT